MLADRDLLFGLLALQNGLIDQVQLVAAFQAWTRDRRPGLAAHLVARGDLDPEQRDAIEAMASLHLRKHGDAARSLAGMAASRSTLESLTQLGHPALDAALGLLNASTSPGDGPDAGRTATYPVAPAAAGGPRFRVLRPHARGGLGAVFVALDTELHREVALKEILDEQADDQVSRRRFLLEAEVTGALEHPGIVPVYGLGTYSDGRPYYAMRFVKGDSLKAAIERFHGDVAIREDPGRRSLGLRALLRRFADVCNAVEYAHSRGVLHRDLKPGNIILGKYGETLVVDWGLAKPLGHVEPGSTHGERTLVPSAALDPAETLPGSTLGTPAFMSPEQAAGDLDRLGPRSDVYSLGATLYCLLTGRPPFAGEDLGSVLRAVGAGEFPPPRSVAPAIDAALEAICLKAMATAPGDRYATPKELADDVERWAADEPVSAHRDRASARLARWARRHRPLVVGAAAFLVAAVTALSVGTVLIGRQRDLARSNFLEAERQRGIAESRSAELAATARTLEKQLYINRVNLALREVEANQIDGAEELLDACPAPLRSWEWHFVRGLCHDEIRTLRRGADPSANPLPVSRWPAVGLSPDGRSLAAAVERSVEIRDLDTGRAVRTIPDAHDGMIFGLAYSPDGRTLATGGSDSAIRLWDADSGELRADLGRHRAWIYSLAFSPDGSTLLSGSGADPAAPDRTPEMKLWDLARRRELRSFPGHTGAVLGLTFRGDGRRAASACGDGLIRLWDVETGDLAGALEGHDGPVFEVAFHPRLPRLASSGIDATALLWDAEALGPPLKVLRGHSGFVRSLAFRADGAVLATAGEDRTLRLWDAESGRDLGPRRGHADRLARVRFGASGTSLVTADFLGAVKAWDSEAPTRILTLPGHAGWANCATFSRDGRLAASGGWGRTLLWDAAGHLLAELRDHPRGVQGLAFDPAGRRLVSCGSEGEIHVWDVESRAPAGALSGHVGPVRAIALGRDGRRLASAGGDGTVRLWDLETGRAVRAMDAPPRSPSALAFAPDGRLLASAGPAGVVAWDPETGRVAFSLDVPAEDVEPHGNSVAFSPDGGRLAVACRDAVTRVFDVATRREVLALRGHSREVNGVCFFPSGARIATVSDDATVRIWDAATGEEVLSLRGHTAKVATVECASDGQRLITAGPDRTAKIWDARPSTPE